MMTTFKLVIASLIVNITMLIIVIKLINPELTKLSELSADIIVRHYGL